MANTELTDTEDDLKFYQDVHAILDEAKSKTYEAANNIMTYAYWNVGKRIIEQEQKGNRKAKYGSYLIKRLSQELSDKYGTGFSVANIRNCRQLYLTFPKESYGYSLIGKIHWSHLRTIMRLDNEEERNFYLNEVANEYWSVKELERNIKSGYYKRILSTQFPEKSGQIPKFVKDPYVLEFMGIKDDSTVIEKDVENAIISNLQKFLLEMGRGFCFVDRQMDMYIRMFDDLKRQPDDNPTIGIIFCTDKDETMVKYSVLNESEQIFASKYMTVLPTVEELRDELERNQLMYNGSKLD